MEGRTQDIGIGVPSALVTNALETAITRRDQRLKHRLGPIAQRHVSVANDGSCRTQLTIDAAGTLGGDAIDKLNLTDGLHLRRRIGAIEGPALHKDRPDHPVTALSVAAQLVEGVIGRARDGGDKGMMRLWKVAEQWGQVPEVMVGINDRQVGFKNVFDHGVPQYGFGFDCRQLMGRDGIGKAKLPPQNDNATPSITGGDGIGVH